MIRRIIRIDEDKCSGCGACAGACHEGAIEMVDGKARLTRENYCDGLGDCLPSCPANAISFEEREAPAYDEAAVLASKKQMEAQTLSCGCPGTEAQAIRPLSSASGSSNAGECCCLAQWPVQIRLVPEKAPFFDNADLLVAADCTAYAYGSFHRDFIRERITLIGCPKLDPVDYSEKLAAILAGNSIKSITVARMHVPCCGGIELAVKKALQASGKRLPLRIVTISSDGKILG